MRGFRDRTEVEAVLRLLAARVRPLPAETVPLAQCAGRVLAADVVSAVSVPGFDRAGDGRLRPRAGRGDVRRRRSVTPFRYP